MAKSGDSTAQQRHQDLVSAGWTRRFTIEEPRVSEMAQMYRSMGLEVRIESGIPEEDQACRDCFVVDAFAERYRTIYTRPRNNLPQDDNDDLYG